mmetsp:Transcript_5186/g.17126  ORF Transcript_5186/g.17126 Transcript_5186/m.17126 type:complete len:337 (+) Transcript_5186:186-1196(+)
MDVTPEKGASVPPTRPGTMLQRNGDEIVVCGQMFHTGTRVVTWLEHNGYNAYSCTNTVVQTASPPPPPALRYGTRKVRAKKGIVYPSSRLSLDRDDPSSRSNPFAAHNWEEVRPSYWDIINLQQAVHQVVIHYDGCGTARRCFKVLHDERTLSCHFIIDIDGTVYQTLDLRERAWHATVANDCSIGIEICQVGAVGLEDGNDLFNRWYAADGDGGVRLTVPPEVAAGEAAEEAGPSRGGSPVRTLEPGGDLRPARPEVVTGDIHGVKLRQHDFTKEQYDALGCLLASLCNIFPRVRPTYPRDKGGKLVTTKLADDVRTVPGIPGPCGPAEALLICS